MPTGLGAELGAPSSRSSKGARFPPLPPGLRKLCTVSHLLPVQWGHVPGLLPPQLPLISYPPPMAPSACRGEASLPGLASWAPGAPHPPGLDEQRGSGHLVPESQAPPSLELWR